MHRGHHPDEIAEYSWRDLEVYLTAVPYLSRREFGSGGF